MQICHLKAEGVHGYLPLDIDFFPDLTFVTGLNGCGKTSALRLLMGLLTPQLDVLAKFQFTTAEVCVKLDGDVEATVRATRDVNGLNLKISTLPEESLFVSAAHLQLLNDERAEETRPMLQRRLSNHVTILAIQSVSTPMFLGLDRRSYYLDSVWEEPNDSRLREMRVRRMRAVEGNISSNDSRGMDASGLTDVNLLVQERMTDIRAEQEHLDATLRNKMLLNSFEYVPHVKEPKLPTRRQLEEYREQLKQIEKAAVGLRLPVEEVLSAVKGFLEQMSDLVQALERFEAAKQKNKNKNKNKKNDGPELSPDVAIILQWLSNQPQVNRLADSIERLTAYNIEREKIHQSLTKFSSLVNEFLRQTGKAVEISERGLLEVVLGDNTRKPLSALSSGERQIVVMLAHLSLNKRLTGSGVFIVDEPELSLHIAWQERFVDAIREANPNVQLIMATHSPAIILDRVDHCSSLDVARSPSASQLLLPEGAGAQS